MRLGQWECTHSVLGGQGGGRVRGGADGAVRGGAVKDWVVTGRARQSMAGRGGA